MKCFVSLMLISMAAIASESWDETLNASCASYPTHKTMGLYKLDETSSIGNLKADILLYLNEDKQMAVKFKSETLSERKYILENYHCTRSVSSDLGVTYDFQFRKESITDIPGCRFINLSGEVYGDSLERCAVGDGDAWTGGMSLPHLEILCMGETFRFKKIQGCPQTMGH